MTPWRVGEGAYFRNAWSFGRYGSKQRIFKRPSDSKANHRGNSRALTCDAASSRGLHCSEPNSGTTDSDLAVFKTAATNRLSWADSPDRAGLGTYSRVARIVVNTACRQRRHRPVSRAEQTRFPRRALTRATGSVLPVTRRSIRGMDSLSPLVTMKVIGAGGTNGTLRGCARERYSESGQRGR